MGNKQVKSIDYNETIEVLNDNTTIKEEYILNIYIYEYSKNKIKLINNKKIDDDNIDDKLNFIINYYSKKHKELYDNNIFKNIFKNILQSENNNVKYYNNIISQLKPYYITETSFFDNFCKLIYYNSSHKKDKWI